MAQLGDAVRTLRLKTGSPLAGLDLSITAVLVSEVLSEPFQVTIDFAGEQAPGDITTSSLIGSDAGLEVEYQQSPSEKKAYWHGIVRSFCYVSDYPDGADNVHRYRAVIVPKLWRMSLATHYRVFNDLKTADIIQKVFGEYGLPAPKGGNLLSAGQREYCTQFGETDLAFVSRLLAEEGISYRFDCDSSQAQVTLLKAPDSQKVDLDEHAVSNLLFEARLHSSAFEVYDFDDNTMSGVSGSAKSKSDFAESNTSVRAFGRSRFKKGGKEGSHQIDSGFTKTASDANIQYLESEANGVTCRFDCHDGFSTSWETCPGAQVAGIAAVAKLSKKSKLVVVRREIAIGESFDGGTGISIKVQCAQAMDSYAPAPLPKPLPPGPCSAIISMLKASESDTGADPQRSVKVKLPWADQPFESCWVRVVQGYAGRGWGASFVPRVDQEVLIEFINGDIDRPVVVGALYNGKNAGPGYTSTQSGIKTESKKFNELRFDDKSDAEEVYLEAGKNFNYLVHDTQSGTVEKDYTLTVKGDRTDTVEGKDENTVKGTRKDTTTQAHTIESQDSIELKVSGCSIKIDAQGITLKAFGNEIKLEAAGVTVKGATLKLNSDSTAQLKANASVSVEGSAMAEVKSSGMTTIKGSMTMIN